MKNVDEALKLHLQTWYIFITRTKRSIPKLSAGDVQEIQSALDKIGGRGPRARPRGRPLAPDSKNERTFQSFHAFVFVNNLMRTFRKRHRIKRIPARVKDAFFEVAKELYPKAVREIVIEYYLRKNKKFIGGTDFMPVISAADQGIERHE